jgi:hypothetical protein
VTFTELLAPPGTPAPPWTTQAWLNRDAPLRLEDLRGKVVVLHAFQLLCPACVQHGIPQMRRIAELFRGSDVAPVALHTVFEHHEAMGEATLRAFVHENRIAFPVGIDAPSGVASDPLPRTMRSYGMRGTPTLILIDRAGDLRHHAFGAEDDLEVGAAVGALLAERR